MPGILSNEQIDFIRSAINTHGSGSLALENQQVRKAFDAMLKDYADLETYYDEHEDKGQNCHYPPGMQAESQRLHREHSALVEAQRNGANNAAEIIRLTDECAAKGIVLVPGGENL